MSLLRPEMRPSLQLSAVKKAAARSSRLAGKPVLPLDFVRRRSSRACCQHADRLPPTQFLNRTKALSLYRQFIRATKGLGDAAARWETVGWVRRDFERYRDVVESVRVLSRCFLGLCADLGGVQEKAKTLLALGHRQLKQLNATGSLVGSEGAKWRGQRK